MKYVLFPWIVLVFATSAFGQANCSYGDSNGVSRDFIPPLTTSCPSGQNGTTFSNTLVVTSTEYCVNTNSGSTYASHNATVTGYGQTNCNTISNLTFPCYAAWEQDETDAANASDYNRFYLRAYDQSYVSSNTCVRNGGFRQDFWQCAGVACSGAPPCTVCPKGTPVTCYSPCGSPIILDIAGKGFNLTSAEEGVRFDIAGDGRPEQMGWTAKGAENAFLALPGPDGLVHNGKQLFGNFTPQPRSTTPNGFAALAVYDDPKSGGNGDGIIDSRDAIFSSLRLWIDENHDGVSQPEELHTLPSLGVNSISLKYSEDSKTDKYGNLFRYRARLNPDTTTDSGKIVYDVFFVTLSPPLATAAAPACAKPLSIAPVGNGRN